LMLSLQIITLAKCIRSVVSGLRFRLVAIWSRDRLS
jgi:hypothetical protein